MKIRLMTATLATLIAGSAFARSPIEVTMIVDNDAPIAATLMPTVSVDATPATSETNPATMRIADTAPVAITLMPTVHVTAHSQDALATTMLPTVRVTPTREDMEALAEADDEIVALPAIDQEPARVEHSFGLRARTMPR
jgi:hypothetical protein